MFYKTSLLWKNPKRNGIIIWSVSDKEHLRLLILEKMEFLYNQEVDNFLEFISRYDPIEYNLNSPDREKMFSSVDSILKNAIYLDDSLSGIILQYTEW